MSKLAPSPSAGNTALSPAPAPAWHFIEIPVFGGRESHIESGEHYNTARLANLFAMRPAAFPKIDAPAFIPSTYCEHDARAYAVQREKARFIAFTGDIDTGDHSLEVIVAAVRAFAITAAWLVYSSASSRPGHRKWRIIIPLAAPVDFQTWHIAQKLFHDHLAAAGIKPDIALQRAGQIIFAPNVPPVHERTGTPLREGGVAEGAPLYFERLHSDMEAEGFDLCASWLTLEIIVAREAVEAEGDRRRAAADEARRKRAEGAGTNSTTIERFNAANDPADLVVKYGYEDSPSDGADWRSPHQQSGSYATRVYADGGGRHYWVSMSQSDREAGLGRACASGCHGDAFDLFIHYEHGGDRDAALVAFRTAEMLSDFANIDFSAFDMPEAARTTSISASPYLWRDPRTLPRRPWLFGRWLLRGTLAAMVAPGGAGKSTWLASLALSLASGRSILGKQVWGGPKRVWLWNLEDDLDEMARSIQAAALHHGICEDDIAGRLFVDSGMEGAGLCTAVDGPDGFKLLVPVYEALTAELIRRGIDVLVIDPFVSSHQAEENHNTKIDAIAKAWARVAKAANCNVKLVHHTSKAGAGEVTALSSRGAVALINAARSTLVINRMTPEDAGRLGIADDERRRYINVTDDKHNRAPAEKADWFQLVGVDLGNGGEAPGDNVAAVAPWKLPDPLENVTVGDLAAVKKAISDGEWREDSQAKQWAGKAVAAVLDLNIEHPADKARIKSLLRMWIANGELKVVWRDDAKRNSRKWIEAGGGGVDVAPPMEGGAGQGGAG